MAPASAQSGTPKSGNREQNRGSLSPKEIFRKASQSVMLIYSLDDKAKAFMQGSAVVVYEGSLVTNRHVVAGGTRFTVEHGGRRIDARLRFCDPVVDLCMLDSPQLAAPPVVLRKTDDVEIGERVFSIGAPKGLSLTLGDGLISGKRAFDDGFLLQTSAPISHGSSGGGLFDEQARLVGITTMMLTDGQNLNFAIPSDAVQRFLGRAALEAIVAANLEAKGGRDALYAVDSIRMEGRSTIGDLTLPFRIEWKRPDLYRIDTWVGDQQFTRVFDGIDAWIRGPDGEHQGADVNPVDRWLLADGAKHFLNSMGDFRSTRPTLDYRGVKTVDGQKVFELRFVEEGGVERTVYLDASTFLETRIVRRFVIQGKETVGTIDLGRHTRVKGLVLPLSASTSFDRRDLPGIDSRLVSEISSVEIGASIPDSRFALVVATQAHISDREGLTTWVMGLLDLMMAKGGEFQALDDPKIRRSFWQYLVAKDPLLDEISIPLLRREWSFFRAAAQKEDVVE